ncbi:MAG: pyruvate kinase [Verrucomicrobiota bacterium]
MPHRFTEDRLDRVIDFLCDLEQKTLRAEFYGRGKLARVAPNHYKSAANLLHYLSVRRKDIRPLQRELSRLGLCSLGSMEVHVQASLRSVLAATHAIAGRTFDTSLERGRESDFDDGDNVLMANADLTLGKSPANRSTRIMVTLPPEAAHSPEMVMDLVEKGMEVARINCVHGDAAQWERMAKNVRRASEKCGRDVRIAFDLAGPKLRTGPMIEKEQIVSWRARDYETNATAAPLRIGFGCLDASNAEGEVSTACDEGRFNAFVPVKIDEANPIRVGDTVRFVDANGKERKLEVWGLWKGGWTCLDRKKAVVSEGTRIEVYANGELAAAGTVQGIPMVKAPVRLSEGQEFVLREGTEPGKAAIRSKGGKVLHPASISCDIPELFRDIEVGHRVIFDDGKAVSRVIEKRMGEVLLRIERVEKNSFKLKARKGINVPDTHLRIPMLSEDDKETLAFAVKHGDLVALSFLRHPSDIDDVLNELSLLEAEHIGLILKIETHEAVEFLPEILLRALRHPSLSVMIARGDLGVEVGFERLAEVQEEILCLCEATHIPVIWATQVLESLAKKGIPTRAEVSDAAMGVRAECVMLNKGPYVSEAVDFLGDILERMESHLDKKTAMFPQLDVARQNQLGKDAPSREDPAWKIPALPKNGVKIASTIEA